MAVTLARRRVGAEAGAPFGVVHSSRYLGSFARQVTQSWSQSLPHESTQFGMPMLAERLGEPEALADVLPLPFAAREVDVARAKDVEVATRERGHEVERATRRRSARSG